jgi:hypothetical protein
MCRGNVRLELADLQDYLPIHYIHPLLYIIHVYHPYITCKVYLHNPTDEEVSYGTTHKNRIDPILAVHTTSCAARLKFTTYLEECVTYDVHFCNTVNVAIMQAKSV